MMSFKDEPSISIIEEEEEEEGSMIDESSHVNATGRSIAGTSTTSNSDEEKEQLAKQESQAVLRVRVVVLLLLMATAMAVSIAIFGVTLNYDATAFEKDYDEAAQAVIESFESIRDDLGAIATLGGGEQHSSHDDGDWPFATLPNFQQWATRIRHQSGALSISVVHGVTTEQLAEWDDFVNDPAHTYWIDEGLQYQQEKGINDFESQVNIQKSRLTIDRKVDPVKVFNASGHAMRQRTASPYYLPIFQTSPVLQASRVNENILTWTNTTIPMEKVARLVWEEDAALLGGFLVAHPGNTQDSDTQTAMFATLQSMAKQEEVQYLGDPLVRFYAPVFDGHKPNSTERKAVAIMTALMSWKDYFDGIVPENVDGMTVVLANSCPVYNNNTAPDHNTNQEASYFTFEIRGSDVVPLGFGDQHDEDFDVYQRTGSISQDPLDDGTSTGIPLHGGCRYQVHVYPTQEFYEDYKTATPVVVTSCTVLAFIFVTFIFLFYDRLVERRQAVLLGSATKSAELVSALFPKNVRDRLLNNNNNNNHERHGTKPGLKSLLDTHNNNNSDTGVPIADLYMNCTVMFADIAGFTAWSSTREPAQVFILLESIYGQFDELAKRRRVFKVETIGDTYMAVTGLPNPMPNHAIVMVRFAADCLAKMNKVVKELEGSLGPDTSALCMRFGLHSGPVTAGCLKGLRSRYQLFGDTVNTASRMESTGLPAKIQVSAVTAELLREKGKEHWLKPRGDDIMAKGKGVMNTYWVHPTNKSVSSVSSGDSSRHSSSVEDTETMGTAAGLDDMVECAKRLPEYKPVNGRLVNWVVAMLVDEIKKIVHVRKETGEKQGTEAMLVFRRPEGSTLIDEVKEVIEMPDFNPTAIQCDERQSYNMEIIDAEIIADLTEYVHGIASRYRNLPFHNFDHCCHVAMSVKKLLSRIVASSNESHDAQHQMTYGIKSDPMASFAMIFSALIHDVDHKGVSNAQLGKENPDLAEKYDMKSVAEQNSLDIAWDMLMRDEYARLRSCLFHTQKELMRFRQLLVNVVLATDIFDKELNDLRKARWNKAFAGNSNNSDDIGNSSSSRHFGLQSSSLSMRALIVMEHIIQASDVSHTMQHWHVYQKWNRCLFTEMYQAYKAGRMAKDPSTFWYRGELGFFDNYIIPLARKMKDCGIFGVSSDEYLNYALQNRLEWEDRGQEIVKELVASVVTQGSSAHQHQAAGDVDC